MKWNKPVRRRTIKSLWLYDGEDGGVPAGTPVVTASPSGSVTAEVPSGAAVSSSAPSASSGSIDWNTYVPEEYRSKPYMQNILKSQDPGAQLIKEFDGLQTKLGQRTNPIPAQDASDEDWNKFYESLRPEKPDAYEFAPLDLGEEDKEVADAINSHRTDEFMKSVKEVLHKHGLSKKQAEALAKDYDTLLAPSVKQQLKDHKEAQAKLATDFDDLAKKAFGTDVDKGLAFGKAALQEHIPENMKGYLDGMPNEALIMMSAFAQSMHNKYEKEDNLRPGASTSGGASENELRQEIRKLMSTEAYQSKFHPDHSQTFQKVKDLTDQVVKSRQKQK